VRVPLSWLRDYVRFDLSPRELADQLTLRGMEVSSIEITGAEWSDVVVGRLLEVQRHPNADTLWLTKVVTEQGGDPLEVVCGAQNLEVGQLVPVALPGAVLPGDRRIERTKIRGVVSNGMLCSARELELGTDGDGIHILGTADEYALGTDLRTIFGEVVLDVDVKPNRGDALSMVGLAREIAAFTRGELRTPSVSVVETADPAADHVRVAIEDPDLCPRFTARWLDGIRNGSSPEWMQRRLLAAGMRPISAVVDVTNYVMHELGQPMHAYDGDTVPNGEIVVRRARRGERLRTIDHEERVLDDRMLVIADQAQPIGLAGIMGGERTEVGEETTRVILESAVFHGPTIRNAARRLALRSEASMRHEKGIGWDLPRLAIDRAAQLIAEITGAGVAAGIVDNDPAPKPLVEVPVNLARTERLLGIPLTAVEVEQLLEPLGFAVTEDGDGDVTVAVPPHRLDVVLAADAAEEIARAHGYDRIPGRLPTTVLAPFREDPSGPRHRVRRILAGLGLDETITHALIGAEDLRRTGYDPTDEHIVRVANPLSEDHALLRPVLYPSLLASLAENVRQRRLDAWVFEVGKAYHYDPKSKRGPVGAETAGKGRYEVWQVGMALMGPRTPPTPGARAADADLAELKGILEALHEALGAPLPAYRPETGAERHPHLHPGRAARLVDAAGNPYGSVGELHPAIAGAWGLPGRPVVAALSLPQLLALVPAELRAVPIPAAQPADRDLAVIVDETTPVGELLRIVRLAAGPTLAGARLFDEYRGAQIGANRVSYAIALRFQPETAADEKAVEKAMNRIRGSVRHHLGAEVR
jgi:phenylalanyl-tRNA synthetase beta chain